MFIAKKKVNLDLSFRTALKTVYGIGQARFNNLWKRLNYMHDVKLNELSPMKRSSISKYTVRYTTDLDLKKAERHILASHLETGTYKGIRLRQGMPCNGQRTHSNASTSRRKLQLLKLKLLK